MYKVDVILTNETGLHARPASMFIKEALKYKSEIKVIKNSKEYNGKSIISILSMNAIKGSLLTITADGVDEMDALGELKNLIDSDFVK